MASAIKHLPPNDYMENKIIGFILIGIAALTAFVTYSFNLALLDIINTSCSHGSTCPMYGAIDFQNYLAIGVIVLILLFALYLIFIPEQQKKKNHNKTLKKLSPDEKLIFEKIIANDGSVFQAELIEKTNLTKVKVTRILDSLEGKGLVERKRRGMTNVVLLK